MRYRRARTFVAVSIALLVAACQPVRNPATGELQYTSMTPEQEARIGREEHPKILRRFGGEYDDPQLRAYVREVGERVATASELAGQPFTFTLLDSADVNAFALPGGFVYITRGLLALAEDEAELAGVLGHEIGHVTARHTAQRYDKAVQGQLGALGATLLGAVLLGETGARLGQQLGSLGATAWVQGFSRQQEFEADQLGIRYLVRAGYDPRAMASLLDSLEGWDRYRERISGGRGNEIPSWLASHPRTRDRVREAALRAAREGGAGERRRDRYLAAIDGMIFGDSPAHGWAEGRRFVHPALRFVFEVPEGFTIVNRPDVVLARGPDDRLLLFDIGRRRGGVSLERYVTGDWLEGVRPRVLEPGRTDRGYQVVTARVTARLDGRPQDVMVAAVEGEGDTVYRFMMLRERLTARDLRAFEGVLDSFRRLSAEEAARFRPLRLRIHRVRAGESVAELATRMDVPQAAEELLRVLNDAVVDRLAPGEQVKLVRRE